MKKQNWKKNKKSTASLRKILTALSKDLPALADDLIGTWEGAANFANDVAESIIQSKPLRVPLDTGRCENFAKYEALGERGWVYLLPPYDFNMLAYHSPLMDHLDEVMEMRLRAVASKYDAAWAKIYAVIGCRFPRSSPSATRSSAIASNFTTSSPTSISASAPPRLTTTTTVR